MAIHHKIKDHRGLVKDKRSGAVLNTNRAEAEEYRAKKAAISANRRTINTEERLDKLEQDLSEIKNLLIKALK